MKRFLVLLLCASALLTACAASVAHGVGGKFVFNSDRQLGHQNGAYLLKGGRLRFLGDYERLAFSPDGKQIAAYLHSEHAIVVIDENGLVLSKASFQIQPGFPLWLDDNHLLVSLGYEDEGAHLVKLNSMSGEKVEIGTLGTGSHIGYRAVSCDGSKVAFTGGSHGSRNLNALGLFLINVDGTDLKKIYPGGLAQAWFPNNKDILFITNVDSAGNPLNTDFGVLMKMNVETGKTEKIRDMDFMAIDGIKLSRDGKFFYYSGPGNGGAVIKIAPVDHPEKETDVTHAVPLGSRYSNDVHPDWYQGD